MVRSEWLFRCPLTDGGRVRSNPFNLEEFHDKLAATIASGIFPLVGPARMRELREKDPGLTEEHAARAAFMYLIRDLRLWLISNPTLD